MELLDYEIEDADNPFGELPMYVNATDGVLTTWDHLSGLAAGWVCKTDVM